ncbi:class I SAM-dependent methyltransferase [Arthrobacter ramosus]|uniref:Class I SAM-dependent methyltransferase n=1 Tax=Arthrobacter ramosus TaxID=1672 RepID=A0ABV5Y6Y2_ARTRM|nr:class I SAM-dependent methyltransferase [Arthrobacter ramosus]
MPALPRPGGFLNARDEAAAEDMDRPDCELDRLNRSYARFPIVNAVVSGWRDTYNSRIKPLLTTAAPTTVLDIGCGGGDVARSLARRAAEDGYRLEVTGIDPDERAFHFANSAPPVEGVGYRQALSSELVSEGRKFDVVISNHVLHHLTTPELASFLHDSERLCRRIALHNDLTRSRIAYALFWAGSWPLGIGSYIHGDGLTSIRRSYTAAELRAATPPAWTVEPSGLWHNLLVYRPGEVRDV